MSDVPQPPRFDPGAPHQQRPRLRPIRGFPAQVEGQTVLGLADARQISEKIVLTTPAVQVILPKMDGSRDLDQIVAEVGRGLTREMLETLVAQLDDASLIEGPSFEALWAKVKADFDSTPVLPPASTAAIAEALAAQAIGEAATDEQKAEMGPGKLREAMDGWMAAALKEAEDPSFDELPRAVVVPHIDYPRGWINYGAVWGRMRVVERPDRVVILGTNHFGQCSGVCGCDKGYQSPLGVCEADQDLIALLRSRLGEALFAHRFDHEREHSIELQIPWIQHCLGAGPDGGFCKVFAALVHDPSVNNGDSYDGSGVALQPFVDALKDAVSTMPGKTLVVASADLSHVGPMFGDQRPLAGEDEPAAAARNKVFQHDREMLELYRQGKPEELVASMAWQQNPTRWCSTGNLVAAMLVAQPQDVRVLNYSAAMDEQGMGMVSSAALAMF